MLARTGIQALDRMLGGGLPERSTSIVVGGPGSGKTSLGLQFAVEGAIAGQLSLFFSLEEFRHQLYADAAGFGWDLHALEAAGTFQLHFVPPQALTEVYRVIEATAPERIVLDSLTHALQGVSAAELREQAFRLFVGGKRIGATSVFLLEEHDGGIEMQPQYAADNILHLTVEGREGTLVRFLRVKKARGVKHSLEPVPFIIGHSGLHTVVPAPPEGLSLAPGGVSGVPAGYRSLNAVLGTDFLDRAVLLIERRPGSSHRFIDVTLLADCLRRGWGLSLVLPPELTGDALSTLFGNFGVDLVECARQGRLVAVDHLGTMEVGDLAPAVVRPAPTAHFVRDQLPNLLRRFDDSALPWAGLFDLNVVTRHLGANTAQVALETSTSRVKAKGGVMVVEVLLGSLPESLVATAEGMADVVLRVWTEGAYQLCRFVKNPFLRDRDDVMLMQFLAGPPYLGIVS